MLESKLIKYPFPCFLKKNLFFVPKDLFQK